MWARGLLVNFSAGKTELLFSATGPGSQSLNTQIHHVYQGTIPLPTIQDKIRVVGQYKHLGSIVTGTGNMGPELALRRANHKQALGALNKTILKQPAIETKDKTTFAEAIGNGALLYNLAVWDPLTTQQHDNMHNALANTYRKVHQLPHDNATKDRTSTNKVFHTAQAHNFDNQATLARIRYLGRMIIHGPVLLFHLLNDLFELEAPGFTTSIVQDLCNLYSEFDNELKQHIHHPFDRTAWSHFVRSRPKHWKSLASRFKPRLLQQQQQRLQLRPVAQPINQSHPTPRHTQRTSTSTNQHQIPLLHVRHSPQRPLRMEDTHGETAQLWIPSDTLCTR